MTRLETNQSNMMLSVSQFFLINEVLISNNPAIVAACNKLKSFNSDIESQSQAQAISTKADTAIKGEVKQNLIKTTLKVVGAMAAHAASTGDTRLKMIADISKSELDEIRENDFEIKINAIREAAMPIATELAIWGVTQSDIDTLDTETSNFKSKSPSVRNVKAKSTQATTSLKATLDEARAHLKNILDPMMLPFKNLNPSFHGEYLNARAIIDLAASHAPEKPVV